MDNLHIFGTPVNYRKKNYPLILTRFMLRFKMQNLKERNLLNRRPHQTECIFKVRIQFSLMKLVSWAAKDETNRKFIRLTSINDSESEVTFKDRCFMQELKKDSIAILEKSVDLVTVEDSSPLSHNAASKAIISTVEEIDDWVDDDPKEEQNIVGNPLMTNSIIDSIHDDNEKEISDTKSSNSPQPVDDNIFPAPVLDSQVEIRAFCAYDPSNIWCYIHTEDSKKLLDEMHKICQTIGVRGLTKMADNIIAGGMYLAKLANRYWYRVTIQEMEQDQVKVFCVDNAFIGKVEKKFIKELPAKYKDKDITKVFRVSLQGVKPAGSSTTWTKIAKRKLAERVTKHTELKATLTSQIDENTFVGKITIIERTVEDPTTLEEIVTEIDLASWLVFDEGVALRA